MEYRRLGRTGRDVSVIGFGAWAIGGDWGSVDDAASLRALHAAADAGVTLIDTADVYGGGHSERLIGRFLRERAGESLFVATKMGRSVPQEVANLAGGVPWLGGRKPRAARRWTGWTWSSSPPADGPVLPAGVVRGPRPARGGRRHRRRGERGEGRGGLKAIEYPGVSTVQMIFNIFRQRPADRFLAEAARRDVGVLARVPLASGLLTGKLTAATAFEPTDHRRYNRHGESFDMGETFAGVDYETGLAVVEELRSLVPEGATMAQMALRWILMHEGVTTTIPGAKSPEQARANAAAADLPPLPPATLERISELYGARIRPLVHQRW
jgi:aryl-alcohol dehydrogenase-like predicted oxidoreductase